MEKQEDNIPASDSGLSRVALLDAAPGAYEYYRSKAGGLSAAAYASAMARVADPTTQVNQTYMGNAELIAAVAKIGLSGDTLRLYALLRNDKNYTGVSDQPLLAEILFHQKNFHALDKLVKAHPNIFTNVL